MKWLQSPRLRGVYALLVGGWRLFRVLLGIRSSSAHHAANQALLGFGFWVEYLVIRKVLEDKNPYSPQSLSWILAQHIIWIILLPLFYHQFLIFRNFTLLHPDASQGSSSVAPSSSLKFLQGARATIEFLIYLSFGLITGEAGYLYSIGYLNASQAPLFLTIQAFLQARNLREALECLFVVGAGVVCILVFLWDCLILLICIYSTPDSSDRERYWNAVLPLFFILDLLSLTLWLIIAILVLPGFDHGNDVKFDILKMSAVLYLLITLGRFAVGMWRLGSAASFEEARWRVI